MQRRSRAVQGVLTSIIGLSGGVHTQRAASAYRQPRSTPGTTHRTAAVLHWVAGLARASSRALSSVALRLDAWLERRRAAAAAFHDFRTMSERDLLDIGLTRVDVHRVAWGAHR